MLPNPLENTKAEWDARQHYFKNLFAIKDNIATSMHEDDFHAAADHLSELLAEISMLRPGSPSDTILNLYDLIDDYAAARGYGDEAFKQRAEQLRREIKLEVMDLLARINQDIQKQKMLFPQKIRIDTTDYLILQKAYSQADIDTYKTVQTYQEYQEGYDFVDGKLKALIAYLRWNAEKKEQDALWMIAGRPGRGKSTLAHHIHDLYTEGHPSVDRISFDRQDFSQKLNNCMRYVDILNRVSHFDEANVSKREAMGFFNKKLIDLYESIRGKNGFHLWCNPSIDYLEKKFLLERINGVLYVYATGRYYIFTPEALIEMRKKHKDLTQRTIEQYGEEYAIYKGWFRVYPKGEFLTKYRAMKDERENVKLENFAEAFGDDTLTMSMRELGKHLSVSTPTATRYIKQAVEAGIFQPDELKSIAGRFKITPAQADELTKWVKEEYEKKTGLGRPPKLSAQSEES